MQHPFVSVIIPVYNARKYVEQAVESALQQPETGEVLLVEDGSKDNSLEICKILEQKFPIVKLLTHNDNINRGAGASRNLGIKHSIFDYIAFLDADDYYLENRFTIERLLFQEDRSIDGVYGCTGIYYESEKLCEEWICKRGFEITTIKQEVPPEHLFRSILFGLDGWFHTDAITVKKRLFEKTGHFDENLLLHQDTAMWIKMAAVGKLASGEISKPIAIRRVHAGNRITKIDVSDFKSRNLLFFELEKWSKKNINKTKQLLVGYIIWRNKLFKYNTRSKNQRTSKIKKLSENIIFILSNIRQNPDILLSRYVFWFIKDLLIEKLYRYYTFNKLYG
ncbi:MAG: glycosyltransferase family 2 protein [Candidatus Heimdallarchaeota archaeon]|nr:glycosyltransferase family 2 protein [Candidatus Heimdallarchaeota archaeon]